MDATVTKVIDHICAAQRFRRVEIAAVLAGTDCPAARRIIAGNQGEILKYGMAGLRQVALSTNDPRTFKRQIAQSIIAMRRNDAVLVYQGRDTAARRIAGMHFLKRIARLRSRLIGLDYSPWVTISTPFDTKLAAVGWAGSTHFFDTTRAIPRGGKWVVQIWRD